MRTLILVAVLSMAGVAAAAELGQARSTPPEWLQQPSSYDLRSVWPEAAKGQGGRVLLECEAAVNGSLNNCKVVSEEPLGQGFGAAALQLTPRFVMKPATRNGQPVAMQVRIPIVFEAPATSVIVAPDWLKQPGSDDLQAVWPKEAMKRGRNGAAVMECEVTPRGALEECKIVSEDPPGSGFGAAALLLAPSFAMKPATRDGKPIRSSVRVPIKFKTGGPVSPFDMQSVPFFQEPIWDAAPSFQDMVAAWPAKAKVDSAHVSMQCGFTPQGGLKHCDVLTETPRGQGFGLAARTVVASKFRLRMSPDSADKVSRAYVNLAVHFTNPASTAPRAVVEPRWITTLDPARVQAVYPAKAADAGVTSGKGYADCAVATDGRLVDCKPSGAAPEGMGFAQAAVQIASIMQMNPWTDGGGPVDGVRIRLPVAFNLAPDAAKP